MKEIDGIKYIKRDHYSLFYIYKFTDEIKNLLKINLSFICYGKSSSESGLKTYNYTNTLSEFLKRYEGKDSDIQKGMIGELLSHLIINEFFNEFYVASPFFNKEERNIKKGFDVILLKQSDNSIWIIEVKSGELHKGKDANQTTYNLLGKAKNDLINRINNKDDRYLWINAINDAKLAFENNNDLKYAVIEVLDDYSSRSGTENNINTSDINAILISALFSPLIDKILESKIKSKSLDYQSENVFNQLFILSFQKCTYDNVYKFLKEESKL